jgi:Ca-activated chloride channel family protein
MFNPGAYENSRSDGVSVLEIVASGENGHEQPRRFVPMRRTELRGDIAGPLATLRLTHVYRFTREQCDHPIEAVYRFPLPGDAAVTAVQVRFGDVEIRAALKERHRAEDEYQEAKSEGRQAVLLTRETPDVFTLQVAGIAPDQDIMVETTYVQQARTEGPGWTLRIPLTTSPRYVRSDENTARQAQGQPLMLLRDPGHRFALDITLAGGGTIHSPTHALEVTAEGDRLRVRLKDGEVVPDRDCVLSWRPPQDPERPILQVTLHDDAATGQVYFLGLLAPPARKPAAGVPREVVVLVDHSGSMQGPKWEATDWAVKRFLSGLNERDTFALGLFHDKTAWLGKSPRSADAKAVQKAIDFLEKTKDTGGTELGVALEQALDLKRASGEVARHVLILTDAEVTDAGRTLRLADEDAKQQARRRIDVLCIDAAPNAFLARELAERGGGVARFLTSAPEEEDITTALDEVLADWAQRVVAGLRLEVNRKPVEAAGHAVLSKGKAGSAIDLGDLPAGRSVWVVGRVPREKAGELSFRVTSGNREVAGCRLDPKGRADRPGLKTLFGARRVLGLEFLITSGYAGKDLEDQLARLGYDPKEVLADQPKKKSKVYAENVRDDANQMLRRLLVRESLEYGLASSETAFVAVRTEKGALIGETVVVANALPQGWSEAFLSRGGYGGTVACCFGAPAMAAPVDALLAEMDEEAGDASRSGGYLGATTFGLSKLQAKLDSVRRAAAPAPTSGSGAYAPLGSGPFAPSGSGALFTGVPDIDKGEAVLFDTARDEDAGRLPEAATLVRFEVDFPDGRPDADRMDAGLTLLLFVDDLAAPRARVRLADLVRQGGVRPLNLLRSSGQRVRIILADPAGTWAGTPLPLRVTLHWA